MATIFAALLPVGLLIAIGCLLRVTRFIEEPGWAAIERLVYFVLFPALLFLELARADLSGLPGPQLGVAMIGTQLVLAGLALASSRLLHISGPAFTSLLQGVVRWNSYVAIALAPGLFGAAAVPIMALVLALIVPVANFLSVAALARYGRGGGAGTDGFIRALVTNPLLIACVAGILWNIGGFAIPRLVFETLSILSQATLAIGVLAVGAGLRPVRMGTASTPLLLAIVGRLALSPALAVGTGMAFGLEPVALGVVALASGVPTATSGYILARLLGGDADLMAAMITIQTILSLVTLPMVLLVVQAP
jgi:predicted permease